MIEKRYLNGSYLEQNPDWDRDDAGWKVQQVERIIKENLLSPKSICDLGCGAGDVLRHLRLYHPEASLVGYDLSPQVLPFWKEDSINIDFVLGDFHQLNKKKFDILLMLDVFEHVRDPFTFLERSHEHAQHFIFHIPLDINAVGVLRNTPLLNARRKVGHLQSYTKDLALETLTDCGYKIIEWRYTGASLNMTSRSIRTMIARLPRIMAGMINKDWAVRLLGGETMIVLAR